MSSLRRTNAALQPRRRAHKGVFNTEEPTTVQERCGRLDHRWLGTVWHLQTWRAQHTGVIKRVCLAGRAEQLKQENLISPTMLARPDRKREKPYRQSQSMPRICPACGMPSHFMANSPKSDSARLSHAKRQKTVKVANALVIDITNDSD